MSQGLPLPDQELDDDQEFIDAYDPSTTNEQRMEHIKKEMKLEAE